MPTNGPDGLTPASAVALLRDRGFDVDADTAVALPGGVSSVVIAVDGRPPVVVKRALASLLVEADWQADPDRAVTEARALRLTHALTPGHVPELLDADPATNTLVMRRAPVGWEPWRDVLLAGPTETDIERARRVGEVLAHWHAATWDVEEVRRAFSDDEAFVQLRLDPFHRELTRRHPGLAPALEPLAAQLLDERQCLVHGDLSPKNVLVGDDGFWILDHEVARYGAAVFDVAFVTSHLVLKAIHDPANAGLLARVSAALLDGYRRGMGGHEPSGADPSALGPHVAALLLARVDGKSPAGYLDARERERTRDLAVRALRARSHLDEVWAGAQAGAQARAVIA